ncbi:MAG: transcriptional regulator [Bacteroidota bacterium]
MAMKSLNYRFEDFFLDIPNRQLWRDGIPVELRGRYFDALVLLVQEHGQLVAKDRFFDEVWGDVVVSNAALTQCIKAIRQQLGDEATNPRLVETVPRYGYRFIGAVEAVPPERPPLASPPREATEKLAEASRPASDPGSSPWVNAAWWGGAGMLGGGTAGVLGGLLYGSAIAHAPAEPGLGTASILLVLLSLNVVVGLVGGLGLGLGMAVVGLVRRRPPHWSILGAALGGLVVGGLTKLLGVDAFTLFFGQAPTGITGGLEGAALGAAIALGARLGDWAQPAPRPGESWSWPPILGGGLAGAAMGALIPAAGGRLMGGSLELLARSFAGSQLQLDALGRLFGEGHVGLLTQVLLGGLEGLLFGSCVVAAVVFTRSRTAPYSDRSKAAPILG